MARTKTLGNYTAQASFPLDSETLLALQDNQALAEIIGNIAGDKAILYGCEESADGSGRRGEGYVFLKTKDFPTGEVLYFAGGNTPQCHVEKTAVDVTANQTTYNGAYARRELADGLGDEQFSWSEFSRLQTTKELRTEVETLKAQIERLKPSPLGIVEMYAGKSDEIGKTGGAYENYQPCDGRLLNKEVYKDLYDIIGNTHGESGNEFRLPDLRGRFIVGRNGDDPDYNTIGQTGGTKQVALTIEQMPSHSHSIIGREIRKSGTSTPLVVLDSIDVGYNEERTLDNRILNTGGGQMHENRPPYFVLAYIMRVK